MVSLYTGHHGILQGHFGIFVTPGLLLVANVHLAGKSSFCFFSKNVIAFPKIEEMEFFPLSTVCTCQEFGLVLKIFTIRYKVHVHVQGSFKKN